MAFPIFAQYPNNAEGKISFGVPACCMTDFMMNNCYINTSVQKAEYLASLEHSQMICNSIQSAKRNKTELHTG